MPRSARKPSATGIFHVVQRGLDQQVIFRDDEDRRKYLSILRDCRELCGFELYAYCLMGNHAHILLKPVDESLELIFKRIAGRYVYWYNAKYARSGHLFQDRFKSEPVESENYFLTVLRYIHQNPMKAGLCKHPSDYIYSSYNEYIDGIGITDSDFAYSLISKEDFESIHMELTSDKCLDLDESAVIRVTDEQAKKIIEKYSKCKSVAEFQRLDSGKRDKFIKIFKDKNISIRQISRLTGVSFNVVKKI